MSTYTAQGCPGTITFAAKVPGSILPVDVGPGAEYLVHRHGFLAGTPGIEISAGFEQSFRRGSSRARDLSCTASGARAGPGPSSPAT